MEDDVEDVDVELDGKREILSFSLY